MARLAGFEPTTPWFVAKYSIQLSYSRQARNFSMASRQFGGLAVTVLRGGRVVLVQRQLR